MADSTLKFADLLCNPEDDDRERVAAFAAVLAYIEAEDKSGATRKNISDKYKNPPSSWGKASLLEGAGVKSRIDGCDSSSNRSLWRSILGTFLFLFLSQLTATAAFAFDNPYREKALFVRVGLGESLNQVSYESFDGADITDLSTGAVVGRVKPDGKFLVTARQDRSAGNLISFLPASSVDVAYIATGQELDPIRNVAFTPSDPMGGGLISNPVKSLLNSASNSPTSRRLNNGPQSVLEVPVRNGALPSEFLTGRSQPDLSTLGGVLISPPGYAQGKSDGLFSFNGKLYRGALLIAPRTVDAGGRLVFNAINVVDLEDYLLSVLPSEMPPSWPLEALKAQAIAARSYAIANLGKYASSGYDVRATVSDQVYKGVVQEKDKTNMAVAQTRGVVIRHDSQVVPAFFHSAGGGFTELSEHVWSKPLPYLRSVRDFDHRSPHLSWKKTFSVDELTSRLKSDVGSIIGLFAVERSPSNRVKSLLVVGEKGALIMKGTTVRSNLGLPGTNFNITPVENAYTLEGQGFGHGLGLSQHGARVLAEHGYNARQILNYYYRDVTFGQIFEESHL